MDTTEWSATLAELEGFPRWLVGAVKGLSRTQWARTPSSGGFCALEHVCHLADLEREGFQVRIARLASEVDPFLADFDGDRAARERAYRERDPYLALGAFVLERQRTLALLRAVAVADRERRGRQEHVGVVTLGEVPTRLRAHDTSHRDELQALLGELTLA